VSSQRVAKVESVVQQRVAASIRELLEADAAYVTVTRVDVSPDLRSAIVWLGLLGDEPQMKHVWDRLTGLRGELQAEVARAMTTKYVPQLHLRQDTGGAYAAEIEALLRQ
jgi:ribosome-binding factor A